MKSKCLFSALSLGLGLVLALLWLVSGPSAGPPVVRAASHTVCPAGPPACDYSTIQAAVDAAGDGDVIRVAAGAYAGVQARPVPAGYPSPPASGTVAQVVYISKTVTIQGGYTTTNGFAGPPDPAANPTTLDALGQGRVLFITGEVNPTVEGLRIIGGDAGWLGGSIGGWPVGGGVYAISTTATISNCWLFGNTAMVGGGLYLYESDATLSGNAVFSNTAYNGGGLHLWDSAATLISNTITFNTAYYWGGGLNLENSAATLSDNTIAANTAGYDGGGLYLAGSDVTLSGNSVLTNTASGDGGGLRLYDSAATLSDNTISANTAGYDGGGLYLWDSAATLNGNIVNSNTAYYGGGLRLYDSAATTLNGNTIFSNTAYYGGGLCLHGSAATLNDNAISSNTAYTSGGGLYLGDSAATLSGNTVLSNTATYSGGGLYLQYSDATLTNNVIADNQADSAGSGLYIKGSSPHLLHTTIARNGLASLTTGGDGSGVYVVAGEWGNYSAVALTNTILVSHTVGITVAAGNTATLEATLWGTGTWANLTDWGGKGAIFTGTINLWGDPDFVDPDAGDYHIGPGSAARDMGTPAGVTADIDGDPRPMGHGYDVGADELRIALAVSKQATPEPVQAGAQLTYTIRVTNTGNVALHATITDILPSHVTPTGVLTWAPAITAPGGVWRGTAVVTVTEGYSGTLTNVVQVTTIEGASGVYTRTDEVRFSGHAVYLPVVLRQFP